MRSTYPQHSQEIESKLLAQHTLVAQNGGDILPSHSGSCRNLKCLFFSSSLLYGQFTKYREVCTLPTPHVCSSSDGRQRYVAGLLIR